MVELVWIIPEQLFNAPEVSQAAACHEQFHARVLRYAVRFACLENALKTDSTASKIDDT